MANRNNEDLEQKPQEHEDAAREEPTDAEFDGVWGALDRGEDPQPGEQEPGAGDAATAEKATRKPESDDDDGEGDSTGEVDDHGAEGAAKGEQDDIDAEIEAKRQELERLKHETQTWQGRAKKARETVERSTRHDDDNQQAQVQDVMNRVTAAQEQAGRGGQPLTTDDMDAADLTDEEKALLAQAQEDYSEDLLRTMRVMAKQEAARLTASARKEVAASREATDRMVREMHFNAIREKHEDYANYIEDGSLDQWIRAKPYEEAQEWLRVKSSGTASEVIRMFDAFKTETRGSNRKSDSRGDTRRDDQFDAGAGVRRRSGGPPRRGPAKDDFDSAWEDAAKE